MRKRMFVICFTTGIGLMLYSSVRIPRTAAARPAPRVTIATAPQADAPTGPVAVVALGAEGPPRVTQYGTPDGPETLLARAAQTPPPQTAPPTNATPRASERATTPSAERGTARSRPIPEPSHLTRPDGSTKPGHGSLPDEGTAPKQSDDDPGAGGADGTAGGTEPSDTHPDGSGGTDTPPEAASGPRPVADAGHDATIWGGQREIALSGSASAASDVTYEWKQTRGPTARIAAPRSPQTTATLPAPGADDSSSWKAITYEFRLTVTDAAGRKDQKTVRYAVRTAPELVVTPMTEHNHSFDKYFQTSNGASLATFVSLVQTPTTNPVRFVVDSPSPLTLEPAGAGQFEMSHYEESARHLYIVAVYQSADEAVTRIDLYAKTDEGIPAVISLSVEW